MTRERIEQMPAGREIDMRIAEMLHGSYHDWQSCEWCLSEERGYAKGETASNVHGQRYSTDIAAAWQVIEKMRNEGWFFDIGDEVETPEIYVRFHRQDGASLVIADTAPLAICRAALIATMEAECPK